jgi:hypothetical protein
VLISSSYPVRGGRHGITRLAPVPQTVGVVSARGQFARARAVPLAP